MGPHHGMAGKRQLGRGSEDPHLEVGTRRRRWQHERRLREVHLTRQGLHLLAGEPFGVGEDGQGIAADGLVREDVNLNKGVFVHPLSACLYVS